MTGSEYQATTQPGREYKQLVPGRQFYDYNRLPTASYNPADLVIASTFFYPNFSTKQNEILRGQEALGMVEAALQNGHQMVVVDGGSDPAFLEQLNRFKHDGLIVLPETERGMAGSRRTVLRGAVELTDAKIVAWTEEKHDYVANHAYKVALPIALGLTKFVVPGRDEASFETYPDFQAKFEQTANRFWNSMLRVYGLYKPRRAAGEPTGYREMDSWMGPRTFHRDVLPYFLKRFNFPMHNSNKGRVENAAAFWSEATFNPILAALVDGVQVSTVGQVPYRHSPKLTADEQDSEEMRVKREIQFEYILATSLDYVWRHVASRGLQTVPSIRR